LVDDMRWQAFFEKRERIARLQNVLETTWVKPNSPESEALCLSTGITLQREASCEELLRRPELAIAQLRSVSAELSDENDEAVLEQIEIQTKYSGYIQRQQAEIARSQRHEHWRIPSQFDYAAVPGLSNEVREKLKTQRPETVGHAARIPGMTPAAVSLLLVHLKKQAG